MHFQLPASLLTLLSLSLTLTSTLALPTQALLAQTTPEAALTTPPTFTSESSPHSPSHPSPAAEEMRKDWWAAQSEQNSNMNWFGAMPVVRGIRLAKTPEEKKRAKVQLVTHNPKHDEHEEPKKLEAVVDPVVTGRNAVIAERRAKRNVLPPL
ncbi:hypothetical protein P7C70_g8955, partial [Phenoliferia sp. Uapishka_3]